MMTYDIQQPRRTCRQPVRTLEQQAAKGRNVSKGVLAWYEANRQVKTLLPMEQYCSAYGKDLKDSDVAKMLAERQKKDPEFRPLDDSWNMCEGGSSVALVSMCIKDNPDQTYADLAMTLAELKYITFASAAYAVSILRNKGLLGYYDDYHCFHPWKPGVPVIMDPDNAPYKKGEKCLAVW